MLYNPDNVLLDLSQIIETIIDAMTKRQADILAKRLSAAFVLGIRAKPRLISSTTSTRKITDLQRRAVRELTTQQLGYITEFNQALGKQLTDKTRDLVAQGKGYADIRQEMMPYIEKTFGSDGTVTIDRIGQTRTVIEVSKDGSLSRVEKVITQKYTTNTEAYADMLSRTSVKSAYEKGRAEGYKNDGYTKWRFVGPMDDRARAWHTALIGRVFEYDTQESNMALEVLCEPNCRHRAVPFFDDPDLDTPAKVFEDQKAKAGLKFEDGEWTFGEPGGGKAEETQPKAEEIKKKEIPAITREQSIITHESSIRSNSFETAISLDESGKAKLVKGGSTDEVGFTEEEAKAMKGTTLTHNHPRSTSFSEQDISLASRCELKEIRICSKKYDYIMKPSAAGWNAEIWDKSIKPVFEQQNKDVRREFEEAISKGTMSWEDAEALHFHEVWSRVAKIIGLNYNRKEI